MVDLPNMQVIRQIYESPWYVGFTALALVAARLGWNELEKRWAHQRELELQQWRHEHGVELELLEHAGEGDAAVRAAAEAIRTLRTTNPNPDTTEKPSVASPGMADPSSGQRAGRSSHRRRGR